MPQFLGSWPGLSGCLDTSAPMPSQSRMPGRLPVFGSGASLSVSLLVLMVGTGPRVGLAVQRRHFSERGGGNPHSEDESPGDDQRCMLQHGSCSFRARCPVEAKLPVECFMRMCRMQRNVTKCIGVAGKAAPCGGAGAIPRPRLARYPDAACNQEKEKASGRCFANHR